MAWCSRSPDRPAERKSQAGAGDQPSGVLPGEAGEPGGSAMDSLTGEMPPVEVGERGRSRCRRTAGVVVGRGWPSPTLARPFGCRETMLLGTDLVGKLGVGYVPDGGA
jgi:hypothetical protein